MHRIDSDFQANAESQSRIEPEAIQTEILVERVKTLYKLSLVSIPASFLCATLVFIGLLHAGYFSQIKIWYLATIIISILRLSLVAWSRKSVSSTKFKLNIFILATVVSALLWGIIGSVLMPINDARSQMIIIVIVAGVTAGGLQSLQASLAASISFVILIILPLTIWLLTQGGVSYTVLGIAMGAYLIYMLVISKQSYGSLIEIFNLRFENLALVNSLSKSNNKLEYLSSHDPLTHLPNRASFAILFTRALALAQRKNKKLAILFIDLDRFKVVNDTYGHDIGDHLLIAVADRLKHRLRDTDIVARISGDEFILLLEEPDSAAIVAKIAKEILAHLSLPIIIDSHQLMINASIGISIYPQDGTNRSILLKNADTALYRAKNSGRNKYVFYSEPESH